MTEEIKENKNNLPKGWKWERLGNVCDVITGTTPPKSDLSNYGNDISFFKPPHLWDGMINETDEKLSFKGAGKARIVPANTVLITCIGNLGRTGFVKKAAAFNQQINAILENEDISGKYIFYQAQSPVFRKQLEELATGTTVSIVNKGNFETIQIPLPPKPTQQAIVSKIEELFSELDKGIEQLKTAQQQLKTYRQSVLKWAFEGKLTNENVKEGELPEGWKNGSITDLTEKNKHGIKNESIWFFIKYRILFRKVIKFMAKIQVINDNTFYSDYYINEEKYEELYSCKIKPFDILISLVGIVGKVLLLPENVK